MSLNDIQKRKIPEIFIEKLRHKIDTWDFSRASGNPFIDLTFGRYSNIKTFVHSAATGFGSIYETVARYIADSNPTYVRVKKIKLEGKISPSEDAEVSRIAKKLEEDKIGSNYNDEVKSIYDADDSNLTETSIVIDLYLQDDNGKETFIEMKGPDPNKKEVRAAKKDLLRVVAIKKREYSTVSDFKSGARVVFGITYNNKEPKRYNNWKVSPLFEDGRGMFVGEAFWDLLGGDGTWIDLLEIIPIINKTLYSEIDKKLKMIGTD